MNQEQRYVIYFLRRSNQMECECGACATCVDDIYFFETLQSHVNNIIWNCECVICAHYRFYIYRLRNGCAFRNYEDPHIIQIRNNRNDRNNRNNRLYRYNQCSG
jgi:hypothetical protein